MTPNVDPLAFQKDGFVLVRDVFSTTEVEQLRASALLVAERAHALGHVFKPFTDEITPVGDLLGRESLGEVVFDDRLLAIGRALLGARELVYFGDSGIMVGGSNRGFHKDNTCRDSAAHPDWQSPYTLLRMGLYLEDHANSSGGVKLRRGSHLHADISTGEIVDVPSTPGDVVVWNLRTTHSGHAIRIRGLPWLHIQPRFEIRLPRALAVPEARRRVALFITFGVPGAHLDAYVTKHADLGAYPENYLYKSWLYSDPNPRWDDVARSKGVRLLRPVADWGARFGSTEASPAGYIPTGAAKPDVYPAHDPFEKCVRALGRATRAMRMGLR